MASFDSILQMLTNIANDLDLLLTDLCHMPQPYDTAPGDGEGRVSPGVGDGGGLLLTLTQHSGDTLGKDSFLSSGEAASRRQGDTTGSSQSLASTSSDNLSQDSGHDERTQGTASPLVFDPNHFGSRHRNLDTANTATMTPPAPAPSHGSHDNESQSSLDLRPISMVERLAKTHCIWLLTQMSRAGAVHLLKDRETGVFIIRKSSQSMSLALSVQNRLTDRANVDHYLIETSDYGMRLQGSAHFFHSIPSLIAHYIENLDELPYCLTLPVAILQARSSRELASLAMLGQDFWLAPVSRKTRTPSPACSLHKSCSEPIDIRHPLQAPHPLGCPPPYPQRPGTPPLCTTPSRSVSDFSHLQTSQQAGQGSRQVFHEQFSAQIASASQGARLNLAPPTSSGQAGVRSEVHFGPHVLRLRGLNDTPTSTDSSGGEEGGGPGVPNMQLVVGGRGGGAPSSLPHPNLNPAPNPQLCAMSNASSQTDFSSLTQPKPLSKPNLYSMTPVELLNLPENSYFRSSLSDKMSDYEDIWRSSYQDSDSVRNGSVRGGATPATPATAYDIGSSMTARSDFTKFFAVSGSGRESGLLKPVEVVVEHSSDSEINQVPPAPVSSSSSVLVDRPMADGSKLLHPVTGRLSRLKSSSDSSLATISSPVYAEPVDAVVFRERQNRSSRARARRRSAPSASSQVFHPEDQHPHHHARQSRGGQFSKLATILSPDAVGQPDNAHPKKFNFQLHKNGCGGSGGGGGVVGGGAVGVSGVRSGVVFTEVKQRSATGMSRSQSMRTPQEVARLSKKRPGWQERFNRLKLGTKVLTRSGSPYAATVQTAGHIPGHGPQLDNSLFVAEDSAAGHSVNRFPVYQCGQPLKGLNRGSYFSESSTVQDIISCAMPELMVRPIQAQPLIGPAAGVGAGKPLSEYDNFNPYAPPSASSHGTIFCKPWEGEAMDTLIRSSTSHLPPAMDLQERVQKWQEANQTFHHSQSRHQSQHQHDLMLRKNSVKLHPSASISAGERMTTAAVVAVDDSVSRAAAVTSVNVTSAAATAAASSSGNLNLSASMNAAADGRMVQGQGRGAVSPRLQPQLAVHHKSVLSSHPRDRPQSMYHQPPERPRDLQHPQLARSFSNPTQPQPHTLTHLQSRGQGQQVQGHHHQQQQSRHLQLSKQTEQQQPQPHPHFHHPRQPHKQPSGVVSKTSTVARDNHKSGLSSNCPDVINCHHIAMDTVNSALSDDEILVPSVEATLQRGQTASTLKQASQKPCSKIREYIYKLSQDHSTIFGSTIENFIQCTVDSQEKTPHHVMRNVRQFMTGIKNYLVKHGEGQLEDLIERERAKLGTNEILNIDALIETTLHMCVLRPLKHHIYRLFVEFHGRNNSLELMSRNIKYARTKTAEEIGIKPGQIPPQASDMETIKHYLDKMQRAYSPLKKLENLLCATSAIYSSVKIQGRQHVASRGPASLGADDFLPLLIYVLVHCGLVSAEIEADYMWGLLHPSVLTGEGGYYLTTLSSAVLILKNFQQAHENKTASLEGHLPTLGEVQGFLKIAFPDELRDTILWKTLPVRPNMTTKDVCAMIAHKFKITNPQDYGLILLCDGEESQLADNQCPQILKKDNLSAGKESFFAFKRLGANIAWPSSMKHS